MIALNKIEVVNGRRKDGTPVQPGDWWYCPWLVDNRNIENWDYLSKNYKALPEPRRAPVCICLPDKTHWIMDSNATNLDGGWTISGTEGKWTVSPSIHVIGGYHGWLNNGVLSG